MAKGATHRVPGSRRWRPDMDKHPRSCIEGWAAATDGQRQSQLPCTPDHGATGGGRTPWCTRIAGACTTVACESGEGPFQCRQRVTCKHRVES